jgi:chromate reductase, NAD(P)H dehydrogenase (quinone)
MTDNDTHVHVAAIAGSLRAAAWSRSLLRAAAKQLPPDVELTIWEGLGAVPPFNEDLESGLAPFAVAHLREFIRSADALMIATPEYNGSIPGVLKNALDWGSRPYGDSVLKNKPVAAVGTSPLPRGGASALADLQKVLSALGADVVEAELAIPHVHTRIDGGGAISDPELADRVKELLVKVTEYVLGPRRALAVA